MRSIELIQPEGRLQPAPFRTIAYGASLQDPRTDSCVAQNYGEPSEASIVEEELRKREG